MAAPSYVRSYVLAFAAGSAAETYVDQVRQALTTCGSFTDSRFGVSGVAAHASPTVQLRTGGQQTPVLTTAYALTSAKGPALSVILARVDQAVGIVVSVGQQLYTQGAALQAMLPPTTCPSPTPSTPTAGGTIAGLVAHCMSSLTSILSQLVAGTITEAQGEAQIPHAEARKRLLLAVQGAHRYEDEGQSQADAVVAASDAFTSYCRAKYGLPVLGGS